MEVSKHGLQGIMKRADNNRGEGDKTRSGHMNWPETAVINVSNASAEPSFNQLNA